MGKSRTLKRYTNLASAIQLLRQKQLTLVSPSQWVDRNDAFTMAEYRRRTQLESLLALCFTEGHERFHFWSSFTTGMDGVLFEFDRTSLLEVAERDPCLLLRKVEYRNIEAVENTTPTVQDLPFLKRIQFESEQEYRIIYGHKTESRTTVGVPIDLRWIVKIRLSPWLTPALFESVKQTLLELHDCRNLTIERSEMLENEKWKRAIERGTAGSN